RFLQQLVHLRLRQIGGTNLHSLLLNFLFQSLKLLFAPGRRDRGSRLYQVFPFQIFWIQQRGDVWLPWLGMLACRQISHLRRVVFIRQSCEMMSELVDPNVKRPDVIDRHNAVKIENPSAAGHNPHRLKSWRCSRNGETANSMSAKRRASFSNFSRSPAVYPSPNTSKSTLVAGSPIF